MFPKQILLLASVLFLTGASIRARGASAITDSQIARFVYVAGQVDAEAGVLAKRKASHDGVRTFAEKTVREAATTQRSATLDKFADKQGRDELSETLAATAVDRRKELEKLNGAAFEKAYAENEVLFHLLVIGMLEITMLPSTKSPELKSLVELNLKNFKDNHKQADQSRNRQPGVGALPQGSLRSVAPALPSWAGYANPHA